MGGTYSEGKREDYKGSDNEVVLKLTKMGGTFSEKREDEKGSENERFSNGRK